MVNIKKILAIISILSVILISGCSTPESIENTQDPNDIMVDNNTQTEVDNTETTSDDIAAIVNGEEIETGEVSETQQVMTQQGQQITEEDALEQLINQKILSQKVQQEGVVVTTEETESSIEQQLKMQNMTLEDYKEQIEMQGVSYEDEIKRMAKQMATQKYVESQIENMSFNVTEDEMQEFYEMYKSQSPEDAPSYEELKPQIVAHLEQQKQQEAIDNIIEELKADANIEYK